MGKIMGKKLISFILSMIFLTAASFSKQLSFQIVQHDNSADKVCESSLVFEDVFFDEFFSLGYIVTNSEASVSFSEEDDQRLWTEGVQEAVEGSSDYFVQIKIFYKQDEEIKSNIIDEIFWSITSVKTGEVMKSQNIKVVANILDAGEISLTIFNEIKKSIMA